MSNGFEPFVKKAPVPLVPPNAEIKEFKTEELKGRSRPTYHEIKSTFKADLTAGSGRFMLSELVSNQLSVEQEEQRRFEKKVEESVTKKIAEIEEQHKKAGYEAGYEAGKKEAYEQEKARLATQIEKLGLAMSAITNAKAKLADHYETMLIDLAFKLSKIVVLEEIQQRPEVISKTIADILSRIGKDDDVMIRLSPSEFSAIDSIQEDIKKLSRSGRLSFEVDQRLQTGACIVESLSGEIGATIDEKFQKLRNEINKNKSLSESTGT